MSRDSHGAIERRSRLLVEIQKASEENDGRPPGLREFVRRTGEKKLTWEGRDWPSYGAFLREAGLTPNEFDDEGIPEDDLLRTLAELTRKCGAFPTQAQMRLAHQSDPRHPEVRTIQRRFGRRAEIVARLVSWTARTPGFEDIREILLAAESATSGNQGIRPEVEEPSAPRFPASPSFALSSS